MNRKVKLAIIFAIAALGAGAAAYVEWGKEPDVQLRPDDAAFVLHGKEIYRTACASCHGAKLEGQPNWRERGSDGLLPAPPHDDTGHTWHHADAVLFSLTKFGVRKFAGSDYKSAMPAFEQRLSDDDILAVLSFIESSWAPNIRQRHDGINRSGADQP
jgi:mono/diheme cytochrome c family protein